MNTCDAVIFKHLGNGYQGVPVTGDDLWDDRKITGFLYAVDDLGADLRILTDRGAAVVRFALRNWVGRVEIRTAEIGFKDICARLCQLFAQGSPFIETGSTCPLVDEHDDLLGFLYFG